jgi:hypothetical protein
MAHFAKVENGVVTQVIVAEQDVIDSGIFGHGWVQTSYNTRGGVHYNQDGTPSGREPLHKNYAGIGYTWDGTGFAPPQPFSSWTKSAETYLWDAPTPMPVVEGKMFKWDEPTLSWVEVTQGV